jgi:hypothetical protein
MMVTDGSDKMELLAQVFGGACNMLISIKDIDGEKGRRPG